VKGGGNIDRVKRSLQDLGQAAQVTKQQKTALRTATLQLARANDGTIAGIRTSVAALRGLQEQARIGGREFQKYGAEIQRLEGRLQGLDGTASQTNTRIAGMAAAAGRLIAAYAGIEAVRFVFGNAAELESQTRSLEVLTGSAERAKDIVQQLQQLGAVTPFTSTELIDTAKRLQAFGVETEKVVDITRRLADVSGATGAELGGLATAYGQVQAKGRLQGEELLQFQERGVALQQVLRKEYGLTGIEFQKALEKGQISAEAVEFALIKLTDSGGKYANGAIAQSDTLRGRMSTLTDSVQVLAQTIGKTLEPVFKWALTQATAVVSEIQRLIDEANNTAGARDREAQFARNANAAVRAMGLNPLTQQGMMAEMRQRNIEQQRADYRLRQQNERALAMPGVPPAPVIPPLTGGTTNGTTAGGEAAEKAAKAAEAAGRKYEAEQIRMQARLAENQLQTNEGLQSNAIELDNQRYENSKSLALKQFEFTQTIQSRALNLWSEGLMGPARAAAKMLTEFMMGFSEGTSRVAEAQRTVNDARRALQQAETVHKQTLANMTERQRIDALENRAQVMGSAGGAVGAGSGFRGGATTRWTRDPDAEQSGYDVVLPGGVGAAVPAPVALTNIKTGFQGSGRGASGKGYGNWITGEFIGVDGKRYEMLLGHFDKVNVSPGMDLAKGGILGTQGETGRTFGTHVTSHVNALNGGDPWRALEQNIVRPWISGWSGAATGAAVPMSQRLLPGADMPGFQPAPVRDVKGEGDIAQARERVKQAEKELALIKEQIGELREFDRIEFTQKLTQGLIDQNEELENNAKELQLRNRLTMEGVSSNVIEAELQKAKIYQDQALVIAVLRKGIDAIQDSEDKAANLAALEKMNGLYARQIELIDQAVAAQLDQPAAIALQIGQLKADLAEMVSISELAGRSADGIGGAFGNAFQELITGAASAREVLAGFFQDVAQNFAQMAAEIIAKQMTMIVLQTILKALGAVAGAAPSGGNMADVGRYADSSSAVTMTDFPAALPRALGGGVSAGRPYPVGENGPELFVPYQAGSIIPAEATEALQSINSASLRGLSVPFQATAPTAGTSSQQGSAAASTSGLSVPFQRGMEGLSVPFQRGGIDGGMGAAGMGVGSVDGLIRFETVQIGELDFVTKDEAQRIGRESAKQGAALAHKRNVNNVTIRRQAGLS